MIQNKKLLPILVVAVILVAAAAFFLRSFTNNEVADVKRLLVVVTPAGFSMDEFREIKTAAEEEGWQMEVASIQKGAASAEDGTLIDVSTVVAEVRYEDFDGLVLIGGSGMALIADDETLKLSAQRFNAARKPVAAISTAPAILARSGLLAGKEATIDPSMKQGLSDAGATYSAAPFVKSGNLLTAGSMAGVAELINQLKEIL